MAIEEVTVLINDVEEVRQVLAACLTYFQAEDLKQAQMAFSAVRPSPLSMEIERLSTRFRGYLGDFYLAQREAELEAEDDEQDVPKSNENVQEVVEEELSESPLGDFKPPKHEGRRLTPEELRADDPEEAEEATEEE